MKKYRGTLFSPIQSILNLRETPKYLKNISLHWVVLWLLVFPTVLSFFYLFSFRWGYANRSRKSLVLNHYPEIRTQSSRKNSFSHLLHFLRFCWTVWKNDNILRIIETELNCKYRPFSNWPKVSYEVFTLNKIQLSSLFGTKQPHTKKAILVLNFISIWLFARFFLKLSMNHFMAFNCILIINE